MGELIRREFKSPGDVEQVKDWIILSSYFYFDMSALLGSRICFTSSAISRTRQLAQDYVDGATKVLQELPHSEARDMLQVLAEDIVARKQ